ncbi:hypothetical protein QC761_0099100 [Podospora bellae-mahoneyi]|uniref:Uncharacterized protein n=1 Tax=Podospora bellae-mahoneyi TaxID=2093777 RepID=A0ABR0FBT7_9PEZI|nr:hypothetical protein QC761_0099100 [Podospora bellae-mahoneyi]
MKLSSCLAAIPFAFSRGALAAALPPPPPEPLPLVPEPMAIPEESVESLSAPSEDETLHPHLA